MDSTSKTGLRFSLNQLLVATAALAIPMALLSQYWAGVNNTVDERTVPFAEAGLLRQAFFVLGLTIVLLLLGAFFVSLVRRKLYLGVLLLSLGLAIAIVPSWRAIQTKIIDPVRGNEIAELHNDAASIAAMAVERYCNRTKNWPASWGDLKTDLSAVIDEIKAAHSDPVALANSLDPFASNADSSSEESQSILGRLPDVSKLRPDDLQLLVDVDFKRSVATLSRENWIEFSGIKPHKPTYNTYRVEFRKLIETLSIITSSESQSK